MIDEYKERLMCPICGDVAGDAIDECLSIDGIEVVCSDCAAYSNISFYLKIVEVISIERSLFSYSD